MSKWLRKTITLPGCAPFGALVKPRANKYGLHYFVGGGVGAEVKPDAISDPRSLFVPDYIKLEEQFADIKVVRRKVKVELVKDYWCVTYCDRKKGGATKAASFYAPDHSREWVERWVTENPKLELIKV